MKTGVYGFSWTYLFFGWFVPLFRGETQTGFVHLLLSIITGGIYQIVMCFKYNEQYMSRMITNGWVLAGSEDENRQAEAELGIINVNKEKTTNSVIETTSENSSESPEDRLQKLGDMKEKGLVNEDEFNSKKAEILKEM